MSSIGEWKQLSLGSLLESITAGTSTGGEDRRAGKDEFGVLTLSSVANGIFDPTQHKAVALNLVHKLKTPVRAGTILISRSNTIDLVGASAYIEKDIPHLFLSDLLWELKPKESTDLIPKWLGYVLSSPKIRLELQRRASGSSGSMKKLSMSRLRSVILEVPPVHIQKSTCLLIDKVNSAIQLTKELIAAKRSLKQGLMQQLLTGKRRFPNFRQNTNYHLTSLGCLPSDWEIKKISSIAQVDPELLSNDTAQDYQFRYIDISAVESGKITIPSEYIQYCNSPSRARRVVRCNDILMSTVRPYLKSFAHLEEEYDNLICSTGFAVIRATNPSDARYIYEFLFSHLLSRQVNSRLVGSSYPAINSSDVKSLLIPWASYQERCLIGELLYKVSKEILLLEKQLQLLQLQKRGLMQKLPNGEIRVPISEENES